LPQFGTNLIKYIFDQDDSITWDAVKNEVSESVRRWSTNLAINNIQVVKNEEDESEIYVRLDYSVIEGNKVTNDSVVVQV
jgi:phage baseplate assembly protein W